MIAGIRCYACDRAHQPQALLTVCGACGMPLRAQGYVQVGERVVVFNTGTGLKYR